MQRARPIAGAICVLSIAGLAFLSSCSEHSRDKVPRPVEPAPEFSLAPLFGAEPVELASLKGRTVVLDFWATWCVPCEFQVPELNAFHDAHRTDTDISLFGISVDTEGADVVAAWTAERGVRYPILLGGDELAREFGVDGFPTVVVVKADGNIDSRHVGLIQQSELEEILTRLRGE